MTALHAPVGAQPQLPGLGADLVYGQPPGQLTPARPALIRPDTVSTFAGPGGWCEALAHLDPAAGARHVGVELDPATCATRAAAGHATIRADVRAINPLRFAGARVLISSPPCPTFSSAGKRSGLADGDLQAALDAITCIGEDCGCEHAELPGRVADIRTALVVEPMRWITALEPYGLQGVLLEQVPAVELVWEDLAAELYARGWEWVSVWVVDAADFGVPQHRRRAVLAATRFGCGHLPYYGTRGPDGPLATPETVLGLAPGRLGFPRRNDRADGGKYRARDMRPTSRPAFTVTEKVRGWTYVPDDPALEARRLSMGEVSQLQGFRADYPWQGSWTRRCLQAANAVPPPVARELLAGVRRGLVGEPAEHPFDPQVAA